MSVQEGRTSALHGGHAQLFEIRKSGLVSVQVGSTTYTEVMHSYLKYVSQGLWLFRREVRHILRSCTAI